MEAEAEATYGDFLVVSLSNGDVVLFWLPLGKAPFGLMLSGLGSWGMGFPISISGSHRAGAQGHAFLSCC